MAALVKERLQKGLSGLEGEAITKIGQLRNKLKERAPGVGGQLGRQRMKWMTALCNSWDMEDFTILDDAMMEKLLDEGWNKNQRVPALQEIGVSHVKKWTSQAISTIPCLPVATAFLAGAVVAAIFLSYCRRS
jgi:precorrin-2 dehydrogenase/sirohydrochlorin ferrochelatase